MDLNSKVPNPDALLDRLRTEMPEILNRAAVNGNSIWVVFDIPPHPDIRAKLKRLGFYWNPLDKSWWHPCGTHTPNQSLNLITTSEFKIVSLRECLVPEEMHLCDTPEKAADYWRLHIATNPYFNPECECFAVLILNTRRRIRGHQIISVGTMDTLLVHPREVFRGALIAAAAAIVLTHNHPSGEPQPSEADIRITRELIRAGQLIRVEVLDHVIMGTPGYCSLKELGYFYA